MYGGNHGKPYYPWMAGIHEWDATYIQYNDAFSASLSCSIPPALTNCYGHVPGSKQCVHRFEHSTTSYPISSSHHPDFLVLTVCTPGFHHLRNNSPCRSIFIHILFKQTVLLIGPWSLPSVRYSSLGAALEKTQPSSTLQQYHCDTVSGSLCCSSLIF